MTCLHEVKDSPTPDTSNSHQDGIFHHRRPLTSIKSTSISFIITFTFNHSITLFSKYLLLTNNLEPSIPNSLFHIARSSLSPSFHTRSTSIQSHYTLTSTSPFLHTQTSSHKSHPTLSNHTGGYLLRAFHFHFCIGTCSPLTLSSRC